MLLLYVLLLKINALFSLLNKLEYIPREKVKQLHVVIMRFPIGYCSIRSFFIIRCKNMSVV